MAGCALAVLVACGELREADKTPPSAPPSANPSRPHGEEAEAPQTEGGTKPKEDATVVPPVLCTDCPVETVLKRAGTFGPIVVDDANVYVSAVGEHTYRCAKSGCAAPDTLLSQGPMRMTIAAGKLWFPAGQSLLTCATTGCNGVPSNVLTESDVISDAVSDGTRVIWQVAAAEADHLRSCPAASCTTDTAVTIKDDVLARVIAASTGRLVWISTSSEVVACKNDELCVAPRHLGSLARTDLSVNDDTAFWVTESSEIAKCPLGGCGDHASIVTPVTPTRTTIADATHVYWRSTTDKAIERCPISSCATPETIATDVASTTFQNLALDDQYVYWATNEGVFRRRK
jgi:hypothetical protein